MYYIPILTGYLSTLKCCGFIVICWISILMGSTAILVGCGSVLFNHCPAFGIEFMLITYEIDYVLGHDPTAQW